MIRTIHGWTLTLAATAVLTASPALAQKGTTGPVAVTEVEKSARSAVQVVYHCDWGTVCTTDYQVPVGTRLVIESITAQMHSIHDSYVKTQSISLAAELNGQKAWHHIPPTRSVLWSSATYVYDNYFMHNTRLYTDTLSDIGISFPLAGGATVVLTGHLVTK